MIADEIEILDKTGKLKMFLRAGVIPVKVKCQFDIYNYYKNELEKNKKLNSVKMRSADNTANAFKISTPTVWRAIKLMTL